MKTYRAIVDRLGFEQVCYGNCGISARSHRTGFIFLGVVHWAERKFNRRGLRKFLLLCARRDRLDSPHFLNSVDLWWAAMYLDERRANEWADQLGIRFPISYSRPERLAVSTVPGLSRRHAAVYAWARRAE